MTRIFTYYQPTDQIDGVESRRLISLWLDRWRDHGFEPHVLNERHAQSHPYFLEYHSAVSKLPTINPEGYDLACYIRWLAVANQLRHQEVAIMADYDVIPYGFKMPTGKVSKLIYLHNKNVPALVAGRSGHFLAMAKRLAAYVPDQRDQINGQPHTSDMYAIERMLEHEPDLVAHDVRCLLYTEPGWETSQAVHYSNSTTRPAGKTPRWQHIPLLRAA